MLIVLVIAATVVFLALDTVLLEQCLRMRRWQKTTGQVIQSAVRLTRG